MLLLPVRKELLTLLLLLLLLFPALLLLGVMETSVYLASGGLAGFVVTLLGQPFDTVKV